MDGATAPTGDFSLEYLSAQLVDFRVPEGPFDPTGDWQLAYGVYTFAAQQARPFSGTRVGRLQLSKTCGGGGQATIKLDYEKTAPGGVRQNVTAEMLCLGDELSTPVTWQYSSHVIGPAGDVFRSSIVSKRGTASGGRVEIIDGQHVRRIAVHGPFTINWALWDAVMRLPRVEGRTIAFTMLDHFDQVKRRQTLAFRGSTAATVGQEPLPQQIGREQEKGRVRKARRATTTAEEVTVHGFDQVGEAIVPWVYWVDDQGRLLFVVAGLEVYLPDSTHAN